MGLTSPENAPTVPSLPWAPQPVDTRSNADEKLFGKDAKSKAAGSAGLPPGTYLKRPDFKESYYRVSADPWALTTAQLPPRFSSLQRDSAPSNPGFYLAANEAATWENSLRRLTVLLNHQHWFLGGALALSDPQKPDTIDPAKSRSLLASGQKAGLEAMNLAFHLIHNYVLHRRDAFLETTQRSLDPSDKKRLRLHSLRDQHLFSPTVTEEVYKSHLEATSSKNLASAVRSQSQKSHQARQRNASAPAATPSTKTKDPKRKQSQGSYGKAKGPSKRGRRPTK